MRNSDNKERIKILKEFIAFFKIKRVRSLENDLKRNNEFITLFKQEDNLYKQLCQVISPEYLPLLRHYNDTVTEIEVLKQKVYYYRGYNDATFIHELFNGREFH